MSVYSDDVMLGMAAIDRQALDKIVDKTIEYYNRCKGDEGELTLEECAGVMVLNNTLLEQEPLGMTPDCREDFGQKLLTDKVVLLAKRRLENPGQTDVLSTLRKFFSFLKWNGVEIAAIEGFNRRFNISFLDHAVDLISKGMTSEILDVCDVPEKVKDDWRNYCRQMLKLS